ncbi:MAG: leucine-rich repeat protein [Prevotellaceae bacterium]|jgi:hypothetical protein|nr:leucine-rich repeat protein [Prevotellaceae bacterium]
MKKISISLMMALCFCAFTNKAMGQTWDIGDKSWPSYVVTASLNTSTGVLSISGDAYCYMADFSYTGNDNGTPPWYASRNFIRTVNIDKGVKNIGNNAFKDCSYLTEVNIAPTVERIGVTSFMNCSNLTSLTIPACVTTIEGGAFYGCSKLTIDCRMSSPPRFEYFPPTKPNFNPINGTEYPFNNMGGSSKLRVMPNLYNNNCFTLYTGTKVILYDEELLPVPKYDSQIKNGEVRDCDNGNVVYKIPFTSGINYIFSSTRFYEVYNGSGDKINSLQPSNYTGEVYVSNYGGWGDFTFTLTYRAYLSIPTLNNPTQNGSVINLSWGSVAAATSYTVHRSNSYNGTYTAIGTVFNGTSITDTPPSNGTWYYKVEAHNSFTKSDLSVYKPANYTAPTPSLSILPETYTYTTSPYHFTANGGTSSEITVTSNVDWNATSNDPSWLTIPGTGNGVGHVKRSPSISDNGTFTMEAAQNYSTSPHSTTVTVSGGGITRTIYVTQDGAGTSGINDVENSKINIYPNPAQDEIFIQSENEIEKIEVVDITGRTVGAYGIRPNDIRPQNQGECNSPLQNINISALSAGVYFVKMTIDKQLVTKKLVKE